MKSIKLLLLCLTIPLFAFTSIHKYYVSTTQITYSKEDKALQVITRLFIDDMQEMLLQRYDIKSELATEKESPLTDNYLKKYFAKKMTFKVNGKELAIDFIGKEYEDDMMICYLQVPDIDEVHTLEVKNQLLFDIYEEQQNILHFKLKGKRKSFILIRDNDKGLLNF